MSVAQIRRLRVASVSAEALDPTGSRVGTLSTPHHKRQTNNSQSDRVRKVHKATVRQDPRRAETRYDNLFFPTPGERKESVVSDDRLLNQWGRDVHVERLSEPIIRPVKKRTTIEIGVDERYSVGGDGLLLGLGGEWVEGSLEAKQGQEGDVNHDR